MTTRMRWLPLVLPLLLLAAVGAPAADIRTEIVASEGFCPPCRRALVMGAPANARGMMTMRLVPPTGGAPPEPWTQSFTADSAGVAETWFPMRGPGLYVVDTTVDGRTGKPAFIVSDCGSPWAPPTPPIDCPAPSPWRGVRGEDILALLSGHRGTDLRAILERLEAGRRPRWTHVRTSQVRVGSDGQVKVQARDMQPGIYRVRFVDPQKNTVATSLAEIQPRKP